MAQSTVSFDNGTITLNSSAIEGVADNITLDIVVENGSITEIIARGDLNQQLEVKLSIKHPGEEGGDECKCLVGGRWVNCPCPGDQP